MITATACGKAILFGEHAVVYARPAIAIPVTHIETRVLIDHACADYPDDIFIEAPDIHLASPLQEIPAAHPLKMSLELVAKSLSVPGFPPCHINISSTIPVAAGLGSGAAVSVALIKALYAFAKRPIKLEQVSNLAFEIEKIYHGAPSGIDNSVITYAQPIYFIKGKPIRYLNLAQQLTLVIADTGIATPTSQTVGDVRTAWQQDTQRYEAIFDQIGAIAATARQAIQSGDLPKIGELMNDNHHLLQSLQVSNVDLDYLVRVARDSGALGAKLSGGGRGGNMLALSPPAMSAAITRALLKAGAKRTIITEVSP
jgi:mevalonate kinase